MSVPVWRKLPYQPRSVQVSEYIESLLQSGVWTGKLPPERSLAAAIGVGRDTVRAALTLLQEKGWQLQRTRGGTFVKAPISRKAPQNVSVGIMLLMKVAYTTHRTLHWLDELRKFFYQRNIHMEIYEAYHHKRKLLEQLTQNSWHDCWIITYPKREVQEWCVRKKVKGVVLGGVNRDIHLPCVDIHYRALHRHAVNKLLQFGHRNLVLILHRREWESDIDSQNGFFEAVESSNLSNIQTRVEFHNGTAEGIRLTVDRLLALPSPPTGWIANCAPHALTIMMHLLKRGIDIPGDLSLISADDEPWHTFASPTPTRYVADIELLAKKTGQMVQNIIKGTPLTKERQYIMPDFHPGATIGPAPH